jgi:hypothetical protein
VSKEEFINQHVKTCRAIAARKYDVKKPRASCHSLEYSRRKCAKKIWRERERTRQIEFLQSQDAANSLGHDLSALPDVHRLRKAGN